MPTSLCALPLYQFNDHTLESTLTVGDTGEPVDLSVDGRSVELVVKDSKYDPDEAGTTLSSTGPDPAITITDGPAGVFRALLPASLVLTSRPLFLRADVLDATSGTRKTAWFITTNPVQNL